MKHVLRILDSPHKQHRSTSVTTRHAASLAFTDRLPRSEKQRMAVSILPSPGRHIERRAAVPELFEVEVQVAMEGKRDTRTSDVVRGLDLGESRCARARAMDCERV